LQKQLNGGTPSIRTIALAYALFGVSVPYEGIEVSKAVSGKKKSKRGELLERQLFLPFEITVPPSARKMALRVVPQGVRRYRLQLTVGVRG
jgi:hypothetical protein